MDHLSGYQVSNYPVHYIPNFIGEDEEAILLRKIGETPAGKWRNLSNRRLQVWGGELTKSGSLIPQDLPTFVTSFPNIIQKLRETGAFASASASQGTANHIILNEYLPGQGITPHQDGPAYHPVVATLSLGSHTVMDYYQYQGPAGGDSIASKTPEESGKTINPVPILRLLLEPRSLVITHGSLYAEHLHGIQGVDRDTFVSSYHPGLEDLRERGERESTQVLRVEDLANRELLGDTTLRTKLAQVATLAAESVQDPPTDGVVELKRHTRTSLTCRVVEKTAVAAGKLVQLR